MSNELATMQPQARDAFSQLATQLNMTDSGEVFNILSKSVMAGAKKPEEIAAFAILCAQYRLNPFTKEVYAFPSKAGGIVPMVGIDGWLTLARNNPNFAGMSHAYGEDDGDKWVECTIYLKNAPEHPVTAREYMSDNKRNTEPWQKSPRRMLKHRATIQAIRYALGYSGVVDISEKEEYEEREMREAKAREPRRPSFLEARQPMPVGLPQGREKLPIEQVKERMAHAFEVQPSHRVMMSAEAGDNVRIAVPLPQSPMLVATEAEPFPAEEVQGEKVELMERD